MSLLGNLFSQSRSFRELENPNVMILCAGKNSRVGSPSRESLPKSLFEVSESPPKTVLGRALTALKEEGLNNITVVVPDFDHPEYIPKRKRLVEFLENNKAGEGVKVFGVDFPFRDTEVLWTFMSCRSHFNNTFVLLGDVVFAKDTLKEILDEPFKDLMFIGTYTGEKPEIYGLLMNPLGVARIYELGNPFRNRVSPETRWEIGKMWSLYWGIGPEASKPETWAKLFLPKNFISDIDYEYEYERVRKTIKAWKM